MRRIVVIGTSGAGKTTLAKAIAARLNIPHIELDALHWEADWKSTPPEPFVEKLALAIASDAWTVCGNYGVVRPHLWPRADTIIWLDYSMTVIMLRVLWRTWLRCWQQEMLWNGNRERFWVQLFHRDSIILWVINSWRKHRHNYPKLLGTLPRKGTTILRFRTPAETERWLAKISPHPLDAATSTALPSTPTCPDATRR